MVDGTSSCAPARCSRALPLDSHRDGVQRQRRTASCHPRSAVCGRAALRASGLGEWCEQHLVRRRGVQEQHAEHHQDGVEGFHRLEPALGRVTAHTATSAVDGRCCARLGPLSQSQGDAPALADAIRGQPWMRAGHEWVASAELVEPWSTRGGPSSESMDEPFVAVLATPAVELPDSHWHCIRGGGASRAEEGI